MNGIRSCCVLFNKAECCQKELHWIGRAGAPLLAGPWP